MVRFSDKLEEKLGKSFNNLESKERFLVQAANICFLIIFDVPNRISMLVRPIFNANDRKIQNKKWSPRSRVFAK